MTQILVPPDYVKKAIDGLKKTMDVDSFYFEYEDGRIFALHMDVLNHDRMGEDGFYYKPYKDRIRNHMNKSQLKKHYFKVDESTWVDMFKIIELNPSDPIQFARNMRNSYSVSTTKINRVDEYIAADFSYNVIDRYDGTRGPKVSPIYIDCRNPEKVRISKCRLNTTFLTEEPTAIEDMYLMRDVKVEILDPDYSLNDIIVILNHEFVPIIRDSVRSNVFYIKDALTGCPLKLKKFQPGATVQNYPDPLRPQIADLDITGTPVWSYKFDMRIFKWSNISVSDWEGVVDSECGYIPYYDAKRNLHHSIKYLKSIKVGVDLPKDSFMVIANGVVMNNT